MTKLVKDLSLITTIPEQTLDRLVQKLELCACHSLQESVLSKDDVCSLDVGFGTLHIKLDEDSVKYKFVPSKRFENSIVSTIQNKESLLTEEVEKSLKSKVMNVYKELF